MYCSRQKRRQLQLAPEESSLPQTKQKRTREAREAAQRRLQHRPRVGDVQEVGGVRLQLDKGALGQGGRAQRHDVALLEQQVLHHLQEEYI
jgi:hypothetical protein